MDYLRRCGSLGFVLLLLMHFQTAIAHETRPTISTLKFNSDRSFTLSIETNIEALIAEIGPDHDDTDDAPTSDLYNELRKLDADTLKRRFLEFAPEWLSDIGLIFDQNSAQLVINELSVPDVGDIDLARESIIRLSGSIPPNATTFNWAYPEKFGASVLRIERPGQELEAQFFNAGVKSEPFKIGVAEQRGWIAKFWDYLVVGFTHILPKGLDHILFVLGLFLLNTNWRPLLIQVTAFTLAHSVTLAAGLYGLVNLSPAIVEPLIALSIVYVAVENIFTQKLHTWRPVIVFLFGLLHGLGFAGILTEIGLLRSDFLMGLVAFNVGVELGQLTVIALAFLAVGWFAHKIWYRRIITIPLSCGIAAMGAWWFIERTLL